MLLACAFLTAGSASDAATPHRRGASLERLKRRSATARWDELRKTWRFDHSDSAAESAESQSNGPVSTDPLTDAARHSSAGTPQPAAGRREPESNVGFRLEPADDSASLFELAPALSVEDELLGQPAPELPPLPDTASQQGVEFPFEGSSHPSYVSQGRPGGDFRPGAAPSAALPKPITAILPYYDYAPNGEDACEYLCPRPPGCPEGDDAKPCPELVSLPDVQRDRRPFLDMHVAWEPTNLFHNPLYFEDHALERYGHTHCDLLQPFVSVGKFGVQLIGLPYQMALHAPCEEQYTLGWHRPGECVPYRYHLPPWNTKAAITAGAAYTGLIFLIP
ncbi:MAG: hypothetical protein AB7U20_21870 [Planctomycetaceae bacterium]